jgi:hypothetical protein
VNFGPGRLDDPAWDQQVPRRLTGSELQVHIETC